MWKVPLNWESRAYRRSRPLPAEGTFPVQDTALYVWKNWACPAASWPTSSRLRTGTGDLPPTLRVVAGPQDPAVDQPGRRRHLGQHGRRILLTGAVEDPGQKLRPVPWREAAPFLV